MHDMEGVWVIAVCKIVEPVLNDFLMKKSHLLNHKNAVSVTRSHPNVSI
jgi:hypothetical protein